jgi:hypothetical protein
MKEFIFLFKGPYYEEMDLSHETAQQHMQKWFNWIKQLQEEGIYISGKPLVRSGKTVSGTDQAVTDGPFAEGKEVVGGFFIVKANDISEAVALTKGFPDYEIGGSVEVREIRVMDM